MARCEKYIETVEEFNDILRVVSKYTPVVYEDWSLYTAQTKYSLATHSFVKDNSVNVEVTTKYYEYAAGHSNKFVPCTYIFRKDGTYKVKMNPGQAYAQLQKYYKAPEFKDAGLPMTDKGSYAFSARPLVGYNKKYDNGGKGREDTLWVYDLNSAYAAVMMNKIPDTSDFELDKVVGENEVGFMFNDECMMVEQGYYADIVFKLIDSPYRDFASHYYLMKKNGKTKEERDKAKAMLVYSVGYLQRHNPFIRAYIVYKCNNYIKKLIDKNTVMWNTDAIYSLVPRTDLPIGDSIGQFKVEHDGVKIRHIGVNYQVVDGKTHYRGVPQKWFKPDWNILEDGIPACGNVYKLNKETLQLEEIEYEI